MPLAPARARLVGTAGIWFWLFPIGLMAVVRDSGRSPSDLTSVGGTTRDV